MRLLVIALVALALGAFSGVLLGGDIEAHQQKSVWGLGIHESFLGDLYRSID